jgi:hypothetical protein
MAVRMAVRTKIPYHFDIQNVYMYILGQFVRGFSHSSNGYLGKRVGVHLALMAE